MKKAISVLLILSAALCISLCGCGETKTDDNSTEVIADASKNEIISQDENGITFRATVGKLNNQ